jgi:DNA polymerase
MAVRRIARGSHAARTLTPAGGTIDELREEAAGCRACDLWKRGTQTVFGAGPDRAAVMLVGEQPGNEEDLAGEPFVGPAGRLLERALVEAGIERSEVYLTNVVKHFKWQPRGKRRIHEKPSSREIDACRPWLDSEIAAIRPQLIVCLGATAAQALLGRQFRVSRQRGELVAQPGGRMVMATVHPSSILRAPDDETRAREKAHFVADLAQIPRHLAGAAAARKPAATR